MPRPISNFHSINYFHREHKNEYLCALIRDNVQLLVNEVWELPTERVEECVVAKLPPPAFVLPRTRKCPVAKPLTKWERFAKEKEIQNKKKDKKLFDKDLGVSNIKRAIPIRVRQSVRCHFCLSTEMGSNVWLQASSSRKRQGVGAGGAEKCRSNGRSIQEKDRFAQRKCR